MKKDKIILPIKHLSFLLLLFILGCSKTKEPNNEAVMRKINYKLDSIVATIPKSVQVNDSLVITQYKNGSKTVEKRAKSKTNIKTSIIKTDPNASVTTKPNISLNKKAETLYHGYIPLDGVGALGSSIITLTAQYWVSGSGLIDWIDSMNIAISPASITELDPDGSSKLTNITLLDQNNGFSPEPPTSMATLSWSCQINYRITITMNGISDTRTDQNFFTQTRQLSPWGVL